MSQAWRKNEPRQYEENHSKSNKESEEGMSDKELRRLFILVGVIIALGLITCALAGWPAWGWNR